MTKTEFATIRSALDKTQEDVARLLGVSAKAVQSFEQGWRSVPVHVERQMLFLMAMKRGGGKGKATCWSIKKCPLSTRRQCPAWEFRAGHLCWFINGTMCDGSPCKSWNEKMQRCRKCDVFQTCVWGKVA